MINTQIRSTKESNDDIHKNTKILSLETILKLIDITELSLLVSQLVTLILLFNNKNKEIFTNLSKNMLGIS